MILRPYDHHGGDAERLAEFTCSTGLPFEDAVEDWVRHSAVGWVNDVPRSRFQRRALMLVEDDDRELIAVSAWQDIVRVDNPGHAHCHHRQARVGTVRRSGPAQRIDDRCRQGEMHQEWKGRIVSLARTCDNPRPYRNFFSNLR